MIELPQEIVEQLKAGFDAVLPALRTPRTSDEAIKDLLLEIYKAGLGDGRDQVENLLKTLVEDTRKIIVAHLAGNAEALVGAIDDFIKHRVIVVTAQAEPAPTRH